MLREWKPLAEQGHSDAQYYLGLIYYKGVGVPRNDETAVKWFTLAAEQGTSDAQVNLDRVGKLIQSDEDGDHREDDLASVLSNEGQPWEATSKLMWLGRGVFWIGLVYIVGHAALTSYRANDFVMLVAKLIFFPITFLLYPWYVGLWWLLLLSLVGYWASTFLGGVVGSVDYLVLATTLPGSLRILCYP